MTKSGPVVPIVVVDNRIQCLLKSAVIYTFQRRRISTNLWSQTGPTSDFSGLFKLVWRTC